MKHRYRVLDYSLGIKWDENGFVRWVSEDTRSETGLQEGDTLLSINGHLVEKGSQPLSEYQVASLEIAPGDEVRLVWIRPRTGRMEGATRAHEASPMPDDLESYGIKEPERQQRKGPYSW